MVDQADTLQQAAALIQAGRKAEAQRLLAQILHGNPRDAGAWFCLAQAVDDPAKQRECLGHVLALNPNNDAAVQMLTAMSRPPEPPPASRPKKTPPPKVQNSTLASPAGLTKLTCLTCGHALAPTAEPGRFVCPSCGNGYLAEQRGKDTLLTPLLKAVNDLERATRATERAAQRMAYVQALDHKVEVASAGEGRRLRRRRQGSLELLVTCFSLLGLFTGFRFFPPVLIQMIAVFGALAVVIHLLGTPRSGKSLL